VRASLRSRSSTSIGGRIVRDLLVDLAVEVADAAGEAAQRELCRGSGGRFDRRHA
jgi:hypothetical protein